MSAVAGFIFRASKAVAETFFPGPSREIQALHDATDRVAAAARDLEQIVERYDKIGGVAREFRHPRSRRKKAAQQ